MNRKQRRAAAKSSPPLRPVAGGKAEPVPAPNIRLWFDEAVGFYRQGRLGEAERILRAILAVEPAQADSLHRLGLIAWQAGAPVPAKRLMLRALAANDSVPDFHNNLGAALQAWGQIDEAIGWFEQALARNPCFADAANNLGLAWYGKGQFDRAVARFRQGLAAAPGSASLFNNLGVSLQGQGKAKDATACYRRALAIDPRFSQALTNFGIALQSQLQFDEAVMFFRGGLCFRPEDVDANNNLGAILQEQGRVDESLKALERATILNPDHDYASMNLIFARQYAWGATPADGLRAAREWTQRKVSSHRADRPAPRRPAEGDGPRRIGFLSSDFRQHAVGFLAIPTVEALSRAGYELICYNNSRHEDALTRRFQAASAAWRTVHGLSDDTLAALIRSDSVDILFDLGGFSANNRLLTFAQRPAPIQVAWLGFPGTTGLDEMDYILADRYQIPQGYEQFYSEKVVRMPDSYVVFEPPAVSPFPVAPDARRFTFGSFNALKKINPHVIESWSRILTRLPSAGLLMKSPALSCEGVRRRYQAMFRDHGIEADRLEFLGGTPPAEHQAAMARVDIALDSFPYSGGMTTLECLWMGLPVITWPGETFCSRHSLSYLSVTGLQELIARDLDHYVELAVALAADRPRIEALRAGMRQRLRDSSLCDVERFMGHLSHAFRVMWRRCTSGDSAESFDVDS